VMQSMRRTDLPPEGTSPGARREVDLGAFPGTWVNANPDTTGIAKLEMVVQGGELSVRPFAIAAALPAEDLVDWGEAAVASVYTFGPASGVGAGFSVRFDFGFADTTLQGNLNKGLMVLSVYVRFHDQSGRRDYFTREYFAVTHDRY